MLSFHNDRSIKTRYLDRIDAALAAGRLGLWRDWESDHAYPVSLTLDDKDSDYSWYRRDLGLPEWLAVIEDELFSVMPQDRASTWPRDFLTALPVGVSEDRLDAQVRAPFIAALLEASLQSFVRAKFPDLNACISAAIQLWRRDDLFGLGWYRDAAAVSQEARRVTPDGLTSSERRAGLLAAAATAFEDGTSADHMVGALEHADLGQADALAVEALRLLKSLAPAGAPDRMLAAVKAA